MSRKNAVRRGNDGERARGDGLDVSDVRSLGFWISNALMIVATILGVYLAASEGFKQAMQFREVEENEHTYTLLSALHAELTLNRNQVGAAIAKASDKLPQSWEEPPQPQRYVWRTMQNVPETFRVPPVALNGIATYYQRIDDHLVDAFDERKHPSDQRDAFNKLAAATEVFDETVMVVIDQEMAALRAELARYGVQVE